MSNSNSDIFNLDFEDFKEPPKESNSNYYKPDPAKAPDGVYKALIRFVPNINNVKQSIINKTTYWLKDDPNSFGVDCPTSIGEKSIINETYWKLKNADSAYEQSKAANLQRKKKHFAYVYIVKDYQNPKLDGTIQIYSFPSKVKEKIDAQLQPDKDAIEMGVEPVNVFDLFEGKDFLLKIKIQAGYWNYDDCQFVAHRGPIKIGGIPMERNKEHMAEIKKLYEGIRPLEDYKYKPWDSETRDKVLAFLRELTGGNVPSSAISEVTKPEKSKPASKPTSKPAAVHGDSEAEGQDLVLESDSPSASNTEAGDSDNIDEFLSQFEG